MSYLLPASSTTHIIVVWGTVHPGLLEGEQRKGMRGGLGGSGGGQGWEQMTNYAQWKVKRPFELFKNSNGRPKTRCACFFNFNSTNSKVRDAIPWHIHLQSTKFWPETRITNLPKFLWIPYVTANWSGHATGVENMSLVPILGGNSTYWQQSQQHNYYFHVHTRNISDSTVPRTDLEHIYTCTAMSVKYK